MHTIDHGAIECVLDLALDAVDALGVRCVIEGEPVTSISVGQPMPPIEPTVGGQPAIFTADADQGVLSVVVQPMTGASAESGWIAAIRPADQPFDEAAIASLAASAHLIEMQIDRALEQAQLTEVGAVLRANQTELRAALDRLEVANGELEQFAYIAAHELVSPLRAVAVYAELLDSMALDGSAGEDQPVAVSSAAAAIRSGVGQMQTHVQQLLQLTRVERDPSPLEPVDLGVIAQLAIDSLDEDIETIGATVTLDALPTVSGQAVHLQSVFANLLSNAIRYRSPDRPLEIKISAVNAEHESTVLVADNGVGLAEEDRQRVFAMFERVTSDVPGFGIGLSLTRRIMERHNASISVDAAEGGGCVFAMRFPTQRFPTQRLPKQG